MTNSCKCEVIRDGTLDKNKLTNIWPFMQLNISHKMSTFAGFRFLHSLHYVLSDLIWFELNKMIVTIVACTHYCIPTLHFNWYIWVIIRYYGCIIRRIKHARGQCELLFTLSECLLNFPDNVRIIMKYWLIVRNCRIRFVQPSLKI